MPVTSVLLPVLFTLVLWWTTTGLVMLFYRAQRRRVRQFFAALTGVLLLALGGVVLTRSLESTAAVYAAATCGVLIWAWHTASYYLGFVTGPRDETSPAAPLSLRGRFRVALRASLHHELLAALTALLLVALVWDQPNAWAMWMYLALWLMHVSAKLNVFFGVRNFRIEALPREMHHLGALLGKRSVNALFPAAVLLETVVVVMLIHQGFMPATPPAQTAGLFIVATMMTLGIAEHWMLVLPLPSALWAWSPEPRPQPQPQPVEQPVTRHDPLRGSGD